MRAVLVGAVESSRVALNRIAHASDWTLALVVTLPPEKSGRHSDFVDLGPAAKAAKCPVLHVENINSPDAVSAIAGADPDFVFVIGWSQICGPAFCAVAPGKVIGYHPAPLPRLRGRAPIPWTILGREPISAGTLFWIDEGVDSGPILAQSFFHVAHNETARTLYRKHMDALAMIVDEALESLRLPEPPRRAQNERYATWGARRRPADGLIDWNRPAAEIECLIRAVTRPYPGAFTYDGATQLRIWESQAEHGASRHSASAGQIVGLSGGSFYVACGDEQLIKVTDWSHAGGGKPKLHAQLSSDPNPRSAPLPELNAACRCSVADAYV